VGLDQLWAAWRNDYVVRATAEERAATSSSCVFCELSTLEPAAENGVLIRRTTTFAVLNAYPYGSGHSLILPRRHVAALSDLSPQERAELFELLYEVTGALEGAYHPDGLNVGANLGRAAGAGIPAHLHLHALPRWSGDTNFMTAIAETRVIPESLATAWSKITTQLENPGGEGSLG
jgi:ATP adenylyltransferase